MTLLPSPHMAQYQTFQCDQCGCTIDLDDCPVVSYEVTGIPPGASAKAVDGVLDVTDFPLPARVRALLAQPVARVERCVCCRAWEYQEPLVNAAGEVVLDPAQFAGKEAWETAVHAAFAAVRAAHGDTTPEAPHAHAAPSGDFESPAP